MYRYAECREKAKKPWVLAIGLLVVCACLFDIWCLQQGVSKGLADVHYRHDGWASQWEPVPGCSLPPAQPFYATALLNIAKTGVLSWLFKPDEDVGISVPPWKRFITYALLLYQLVIIPSSMMLTARHFIMSMGPFQSGWDGYQCFGIMWTMGPWWFNGLVLGAKWWMNLMLTDWDSDRGMYARHAGDTINGVQELKRTLLAPDLTSNQVWHQKFYVTGWMSLLSIVPYLIVWAPYVFTHIIPGTFIFFPVSFVLFAALWAFFFFLQGSSIDNDQEEMRLEEQWSLLQFLPAFLILNIFAEAILLHAVYFYSEHSWVNSVAEVWLERRATVYISNFIGLVLAQMYSVLNLLNESL